VTGPPGLGGPARYCGRDFSPADIEAITGLAAALPTRAAIAEATCQALDWRRPDGATRAMSARVALNKMAADGLITLPPPRNGNGNGRIPRHRHAGQGELSGTSPVTGTLASLGPLTFRPVTTRTDSRTWNTSSPPTTTSATPRSPEPSSATSSRPAGPGPSPRSGSAPQPGNAPPATPASAGTPRPAKPGCTSSSATPAS